MDSNTIMKLTSWFIMNNITPSDDVSFSIPLIIKCRVKRCNRNDEEIEMLIRQLKAYFILNYPIGSDSIKIRYTIED